MDIDSARQAACHPGYPGSTQEEYLFGDPDQEQAFRHAYPVVINKLKDRANELNRLDKELIVTTRQEALSQLETDPDGLRTRRMLQDAKEGEQLTIIDQLLARRIHEITQGDTNWGEVGAANLALMQKRQESLIDKLRQRYVNRPPAFDIYTQAMQEEREKAIQRGGNTPPHLEAFIGVLNRLRDKSGRVPSLLIVHDHDGNLTPATDSEMKPGRSLGRATDRLDAELEESTDPLLRLPTQDSAGMDPNIGETARMLLRTAGSELRLFDDVQDAFEICRRTETPSLVLTANMTNYVEGSIGRLPEGGQIPVLGLRPDDATTRMKPELILQEALEHPETILIVADDKDISLTEAVRMGRASENIPECPPLEDLAFIVALEKQRLSQALHDKGIPHAVNRHEEDEDGRLLGYQGVLELLTAWEAWRSEQIALGWAKSPAEVQAQQAIQAMIEGLPQAEKEMITLIEQRRQAIPNLNLRESEKLTALAQITAIQEAWEGDYGYRPDILEKAQELYQAWTNGIPTDSPQRAMLAAKAVRESRRLFAAQVKETQMRGQQEIWAGWQKVAVVNSGYEDPRQDPQVSNRLTDTDQLIIRGPKQTLLISKNPLPPEILHLGAPALEQDGRAITLTDPADPLTQIVRVNRSLAPVDLLYHQDPYQHIGGLEEVARRQGTGLAQNGFPVRIVAEGAGSPNGNEAFTVDHYDFPQLGYRYGSLLEINRQLAQGIVTPAFYRLKDEILDLLPGAIRDNSVVLAHHLTQFNRNLPATAAFWEAVRNGLIKPRRIIAWTHDVPHIKSGNELFHGYPWDLVREMQQEQIYIPVSEIIRQQLLQAPNPHGAIIGQPIHAGIDQDFGAPQDRVSQALRNYLKPSDDVWLMPSRIAYNKQQHVAVMAAALVPDARLVVTGGPSASSRDYAEFTLALSEQLGMAEEDKFLPLALMEGIGPVTNREFPYVMPALMRRADIGIFSSLYEGWGLAPREMALQNTPTIASKIGAFEENYGDNTLLIPPDAHPSVWAAAACGTIAHHPTHKRRGDIFKNGTWEAHIRMLLPIIENPLWPN